MFTRPQRLACGTRPGRRLGGVAVLGLGATKHEAQPGMSFRVYLDPAGHQFCLCQDH